MVRNIQRDADVAALREKVDAAGTVSVGVRALLGLVGAKRRGRKVLGEVAAALAEVGLQVIPALDSVALDAAVTVTHSETSGEGCPSIPGPKYDDVNEILRMLGPSSESESELDYDIEWLSDLCQTGDPTAVSEGLAETSYIDLLEQLQEGVSVDADGVLAIESGSLIDILVPQEYEEMVALCALQRTGKLATVEKLQLSGQALVSVAALQGAIALEKLAIRDCGDVHSFVGLQHLQKLTSLHLSDRIQEVVDLSPLTAMTGLTDLELSRVIWYYGSPTPLPRVRNIVLRYQDFTSLDFLPDSTESLTIFSAEDLDDVERLRELPRLRRLELEDCFALKWLCLAHLQSVEYLSLRGCPHLNFRREVMHKLPNLRELVLD
jgi:hypothetical protein